MVNGDAALEADRASPFVRAGPHSEHDTDSAELDDLPGADQTEPLSTTESSGQILALAIALALSSPDLGKDGPVIVDISDFTAAKILYKRSSPSGVEYGCELEL